MEKVFVSAIDLFCGAGGLSHGLKKAGISIAAGIDSDPMCEFPFTKNIEAPFINADVRTLAGEDLQQFYPRGSVRLLAGCAPCQPFSPFCRGNASSNTGDDDWSLLNEFGRLVRELRPELITMENVPDLASKPIFTDFVGRLKRLGYHVDWESVYCPRFGVPQHRRRLVMLASLIGPIKVPEGRVVPKNFKTVKRAIGKLPPLAAGESDKHDRLHKARSLTPTNLKRLQASKPGGTWEDWPKDLRAPCHQKKTGSTYRSVYARMVWDAPSPTITTQSFNFGTGRFGHPEQDRSITLREAAILQTFPPNYRFVARRSRVYFCRVGRLIGNAVPPRLALFIGRQLIRRARAPEPGNANGGKKA